VAILPPARRRRSTEAVVDGVYNGSDASTAPPPPPSPPETSPAGVEDPSIAARLQAIRLEAQAEARQRHASQRSPSPPSPPSPSSPPVEPLGPSVAAVGVDPSARRVERLAPSGPTIDLTASAPLPSSPLLPPPPPVTVDGTVIVNGHAPANGSVATLAALTEDTIVMEPIVVQAPEPSAPAQEPGTPGSLVVENLSAWFGPRKVLDRCSLQMLAGRVTAIIGPSGCGKSVFLRNLNRMHEVIPTAKMGGLIALDGVDIHSEHMNVTEVRLRIGMVFQRPNPFPSMSIRENVLAGLKLAGVKRKGSGDDLVEWCLRRAGLWNETKDRLDQSGAALSGGQQQRLCIARALALRPKVLLMDEPCSALDPISTRVIEETILEIANEVTVVIVTHNMQQAQRVADDCAFFMIDAIGQPGGIVEAGPTEQIFEHPRDERTRDYVTGRFG
jgi:phosphate transport system ATP-binding protein